MPRSQEFVSSSESMSDSDGEVRPKKAKKAKVERKPDKKEEKKPEKREERERKSEKKEEKKGGASKASGDSGEVKFELSRNRFASIQEFRGKKLVSIREYYEKDGETLPGKKGISLTVEQWNKLKACMDEIDDELDVV